MKNTIIKYIKNIIFVFCLIVLSGQLAFADNTWEKILEGIHYNKSIDKKFGSSVGGRFYGNAYLDLDILPPYGKAGVFAEGSAFIKDVHSWSIIKAEGFIEGGLKISTEYNNDTDELIVTYTAGADAVVDIDFLKKQIYYFSVNDKLEQNGKKPIKKSWESRIDMSRAAPFLEKAGDDLGVGKAGVIQLIADTLTETIKLLIKNNIRQNGRELTLGEKLNNISKVVANQFYKYVFLKIASDTNKELTALLKNNVSPVDIINTIQTGSGSGDLSKLGKLRKKMKALHLLYKVVNKMLSITNGSCNGIKVGLGKEYKWEKKLPGYSQTFMVGGIVPVSVEFGGSAALGAKWDVALQLATKKNSQSSLSLQVGPFVNAGAYASAALNAIIFKAGIEGTLELIRDDLTVKLQSPFPKVWTDLSGSLNNELSTANGKMSAFVSWTEIKFGKRVCKKRLYWKRWRFYRKYTCRWEWWHVYTKTQKASTTLFSIKGPSWTIQYPIFKFKDPQMQVINVSDSGGFSSDLF